MIIVGVPSMPYPPCHTLHAIPPCNINATLYKLPRYIHTKTKIKGKRETEYTAVNISINGASLGYLQRDSYNGRYKYYIP